MNNIEQLKRYVVTSKDLSEPLNYFFDLSEANAFSKIKSHSVIKDIHQHPELLAVVSAVQKEANERLGKSIKKLVPLFNEIPEYHFYHGACLPNDSMMPLTVIYFSDVKTGIFATATGTNTEMFRFCLMKASEMMNKQ